MHHKELIENIISTGRTVLNEFESKKILDHFGIDVVFEMIVSNIEEACEAANIIGYPVVCKAYGSDLLHKTELNLVSTNILDEKNLRFSSDHIIKNAGSKLEGLLIQPFVEGKRELVAGIFQDQQFGHVIMFGIGGIFTEVLNDVVFRLAPLTESDAYEMINSIKAKNILKNFRGESQVNIKQLIQVLLGLSKMTEEIDSISEVDVNPLIVNKKGDVKAVDALIILKKEIKKSQKIQNVDLKKLGELFYPKSIAFIGVSSKFGKWGHNLLTNTISGGFKGKIYLVNPNAQKIAGYQVYKSIKDIEDNIDLAVVTIPATQVRDLISQCKYKGIKGILLISSGFREIGEEGLKLEQELVEEAFKSDIIILGPNTMGICNPHINFYCCGVHFHPIAGTTTLVSQSGNMGSQLLAFAERQGIGIRAFSGSGNEAMVTIEDYMEAFELDDQSRTVVLYLESVKYGRRFFESAKRVAKKKPIVILKGGRTEAGSIAASSHTGAMASNSRVFDAACTQAGIIQVSQPMDLLDLSAVFSSLPIPQGRNVAIMTLGGGWGVVTADLCAEYNLIVPQLSSSILKIFDEMLPDYWSRGNPVDLVGENNPDLPLIGLETLLKWEKCDAVIHLGINGKIPFVEKMISSVRKTDSSYKEDFFEKAYNNISIFEKKYNDHVVNLICKYNKPVLGVSLFGEEETLYNIEGKPFKAVIFPSPERAVKALSKMCDYKDWLKK